MTQALPHDAAGSLSCLCPASFLPTHPIQGGTLGSAHFVWFVCLVMTGYMPQSLSSHTSNISLCLGALVVAFYGDVHGFMESWNPEVSPTAAEWLGDRACSLSGGPSRHRGTQPGGLRPPVSPAVVRAHHSNLCPPGTSTASCPEDASMERWGQKLRCQQPDD